MPAWTEHLAAAIAAGYDPKKDLAVTKQRDDLLSAKATAELHADELKAKVASLTTEYQSTKKANIELTKELETAKTANAEYEANKAELEKYKASQAEALKTTQAELAAAEKIWKAADPEALAAVPDLEPAEKLAWMKKYQDRFVVIDENSDENNQSSDENIPKQPPTGKPNGGNPAYTKNEKEFAAKAGISEKAASAIIKARMKKEQENKGN